MSDPLLRTEDLSVGYRSGHRQRLIAHSLNLAMTQGQLICLLGPNGAGKSTLMRTLAGAQPALVGQVLIGGDDVSKLAANMLAQRMALVLTERVDVGHLSAYGLAALGRYPYTGWSGKLNERDHAITQHAMRAARCEALAGRIVGELSDGERQRVMIARALAQETPIVLLDEPTAFLDLPRRIEIMLLLRELAHTRQKSLLLSTHDLELALRYADQLWLMSPAGAIVVGTPDVLKSNNALLHTFASEGVEVSAYLSELLT
jgi:iron complex transport system ATP-binding protein